MDCYFSCQSAYVDVLVAKQDPVDGGHETRFLE